MQIKLDKLAATIAQELQLYSRDVQEVLNREGGEIAKSGVAKLREASPERSRRYARGWTMATESAAGRPPTYIIYNKDRPGLAHLLEHGHVKRGGGRVQGQPHIGPVEAEVVEAYLAAVRGVLQR